MSGKAFVMGVERYGMEARQVREVICRPAVATAKNCRSQAGCEAGDYEQENDLLAQLLATGTFLRVR